MKTQIATFAIANFANYKQQMLSWANQFNICCLLDNHQYPSPHHAVECLLAVNPLQQYSANTNGLAGLKKFINNSNSWFFGHVNYDVKNEIFNTTSTHKNNIQFPEIFFFIPAIVIELTTISVTITSYTLQPNLIHQAIAAINLASTIDNNITSPKLQPKISKEKYLETIKQLQKHIQRGDCYEINFCQEFFAENAVISPLHLYHNLTKISPNPFSCYYKLQQQYLLCASPERYVKKTSDHIISQPIKGTSKRTFTNDELEKEQLKNSSKNKSENVMIVDLVRNDLSKICTRGSVKVDELFGVYTFPQVHQMISTISGTLQNNIDFVDVLQATFPMGSMTGAPKKKVLQLTEQYEQTKRGIYSGCVGYINPQKNFDFNVVIRSIMYNANQKFLNYLVGGGITFYSNAQQEYEECLIKAEAINTVLKN